MVPRLLGKMSCVDEFAVEMNDVSLYYLFSEKKINTLQCFLTLGKVTEELFTSGSINREARNDLDRRIRLAKAYTEGIGIWIVRENCSLFSRTQRQLTISFRVCQSLLQPWFE